METIEHTRFDSFDRLIKHFDELANSIDAGSRAIMALCYLYDAPPFKAPPRDKYNTRIIDAAKAAFAKGVENCITNIPDGGLFKGFSVG